MKSIDQAIPIYVGGFVAGIIFGYLILVILEGSRSISWALEHEALAAGLLGIFAAGMTAVLLFWQIVETRKAEMRSRLRKLEASKTELVFVLSELTTYSRECLKISLDMCMGANYSPVAPAIPSRTFEVLRRCVEHANDPHFTILRELIVSLQIQDSRLRGAIEEYEPWSADEFEENIATGNVFADERAIAGGGYVYSSALIHIIVNELWAFARSLQVDEISLKRADRISNLFMFLDDENFRYDPQNWPQFIAHFQRTADKHQSRFMSAV